MCSKFNNMLIHNIVFFFLGYKISFLIRENQLLNWKHKSRSNYHPIKSSNHQAVSLTYIRRIFSTRKKVKRCRGAENMPTMTGSRELASDLVTNKSHVYYFCNFKNLGQWVLENLQLWDVRLHTDTQYERVHTERCLQIKAAFDCDTLSSTCTPLFQSHSGFLCFGLWCSAETHRDVYWGSCVTWSGPWWTRFYYTGPVTQIPSQSVEEDCEREWRHTPKRRSAAERRALPPVNYNSQNRLNDAGFLKRPAGWSCVKEDLMSHSLRWDCFLSIIISYTMT